MAPKASKIRGGLHTCTFQKHHISSAIVISTVLLARVQGYQLCCVWGTHHQIMLAFSVARNEEQRTLRHHKKKEKEFCTHQNGGGVARCRRLRAHSVKTFCEVSLKNQLLTSDNKGSPILANVTVRSFTAGTDRFGPRTKENGRTCAEVIFQQDGIVSLGVDKYWCAR